MGGQERRTRRSETNDNSIVEDNSYFGQSDKLRFIGDGGMLDDIIQPHLVHFGLGSKRDHGKVKVQTFALNIHIRGSTLCLISQGKLYSLIRTDPQTVTQKTKGQDRGQNENIMATVVELWLDPD